MHINWGHMYPPPIEPTATKSNYTKAVANIAQCTYTQVRHTLSRTQGYRAQLHQNSFWYSTMHIFPGQMYPPQIQARATEPDYTKAVSNIAQCTYTQVRCTPSWTQSYRAQLHQSSFQYSTMHIYPGKMYPLQIKPRPTEPDYTKAVSNITHAHKLRSHVPPPIEPTATESNYTKAVANIAQCTYTQVRHTLSRTKGYRAQLHQNSFWYSHNAHIPRSDVPPVNLTQR